MTIRADNFEFVCQLLRKRSAIVLNDSKKYLVTTRLLRVARRAKLSSVDELIDQLRRSPDEGQLQLIVDALTTNETSFFRDGGPFRILSDIVLPELLARRAAVRTLNIWSAACASGQEPYTLAMLWCDRFAKQAANWRVRLLATDISAEMLDRGREGRYSSLEMQRGLPAEQRAKYFRQDGDTWLIDERLRALVEFRALNLSGAWPQLPPMDVILLRNVLVYFDLPTKQQILRRVRSLLRPDGCLLLGGTETTLMIDDAFQRVATPAGSYYMVKDDAVE